MIANIKSCQCMRKDLEFNPLNPIEKIKHVKINWNLAKNINPDDVEYGKMKRYGFPLL